MPDRCNGERTASSRWVRSRQLHQCLAILFEPRLRRVSTYTYSTLTGHAMAPVWVMILPADWWSGHTWEGVVVSQNFCTP
ncbi:hypothetical protein BDV98DRAFT_420329 [Pterulicium gracile]|uniref:Uncharacterized protein n=1 Tax=Pterulicium gracile TaxID=1884261 RepID=A0A5C3QY05_9AGAR|nr:hypothetical protein BDV98DRAFT_420329 [Pterula gracilis]